MCARRQMERYARRATPHANRLKHPVQRSLIAIRQIEVELAAGNQTKRLRRCRVGFYDAQIRDANKGDHFSRGLQKRPVTGLNLAKPPVVPFTFLLGERETRLEFGNHLEALADRDESGLLAEIDGCVFDQEFAPARHSLIDREARRPARVGPSSTLCATSLANSGVKVSFQGKPLQGSRTSPASRSAETALRITPSPSTARVMSGRTRNSSIMASQMRGRLLDYTRKTVQWSI